jgi:hypothetical protein
MASLTLSGGTMTITSQSGSTLNYSYVDSSSNSSTGTIDMTQSITINNPSTYSTLTIQFGCNITISNSAFYFIISPNILVNGGNSSGFSVTFSNVQNYIGLIQCNETLVTYTFSTVSTDPVVISIEYITVTDANIKDRSIPVSTLSSYAGWICGSYFGDYISSENINGPAIYTPYVGYCNNSCTVNGEYCGGIIGAYYGGYEISDYSIVACQNFGNITGSYAGGIVGGYYGNNVNYSELSYCANSGNVIGNYAGGIIGGNCNLSSLSSYVVTSANTGQVTGENAYGIYGYNITTDIYVFGSVENCYTLYGGINQNISQSYGETSGNLYVANGTWSTSDVINNQYLEITNDYNNANTNYWVYSPLGNNYPFLVAALYPNNTNYVTTTVPSDVPKYKTRTELARPAMVRTQRLETVSTNNVFPGDLLLLKDGTTFDLTTVVGLGSIFIAEPLTHSYIAGTPVYIYPPNTTLSEILAEQNLPIPIADICFVKHTPIETDQGIVPIHKIDPSVNTINNKKIITITKSVTEDNFLVCFEKHALGENIPSTRTIISKYHKIQNEHGKMIQAYKYLEYYENVKKIKYDGELLYNILMEDHEKLNVNNLVCETLHPDHEIAKLYKNNYSDEYTNTVVMFMNYSKKVKDIDLRI